MANPLFGGMQGASAGMGANPMANAEGMAFNPAMAQKVSQVMGMINRGANIKDVIKTFKKSGMSPQVIEQVLCMASPQMKQIKEQMDNMKKSGMSQQEMFAEFAKQANVDPSKINDTYNNLMRLVK